MSKPVKVTVAIFLFLLTFTSPLSASTRIQDVEVGFSPGRTAQKIILLAIEEAKTSIERLRISTSKNLRLGAVVTRCKAMILF